MNNKNMKDFITPKERLRTASFITFNRYDLIALIIFVCVLGGVQSWL